jgi:hypothetical protein
MKFLTFLLVSGDPMPGPVPAHDTAGAAQAMPDPRGEPLPWPAKAGVLPDAPSAAIAQRCRDQAA